MLELHRLFSVLQKSVEESCDGKFRLSSLHYLREHQWRYEQDLSCLINQDILSKKSKILDVGAHPYHFTWLLKESGYPVVGVDIAPERLKKFIQANSLRVIKIDIEAEIWPFRDRSFDVIVMNEVLEHLRINPLHALTEAYRILDEKGLLLLTTSNIYALLNVVRFFRGRGAMGNMVDEFAKLYWLGHMGHIHEYSAHELRDMLHVTGFVINSLSYRNVKKTHGFHSLNLKWKVLTYIDKIIEYFIPFFRRHLEVIACKGSRPASELLEKRIDYNRRLQERLYDD